MTTYGRTLVSQTGTIIMVSADGLPFWKSVGITIDWATVVAAGSDTTLPDGVIVKTGFKGLQFGQVLTKITASGKYGPFNGTAVATPVAAPTLGAAGTDGTLPAATYTVGYSWYTAAGESALSPTATQAVASTNHLTVTPIALPAGATGYNVYISSPTTPGLQLAATVVGAAAVNILALPTPSARGAPTVNQAYTGTDGRQLLNPGDVCVLNATQLEKNPDMPYLVYASDHPGVIVGGLVWRDRLLVGSNVPTVGGGGAPTLAALLATCPTFRFANA